MLPTAVVISAAFGTVSNPHACEGKFMIVASTLGEFISDPLGRCFVGTSSAIWCSAPDVVGVINRGVVDGAYLRELREAIAFADGSGSAAPIAVFADWRDVERAEPDAMLELASLARDLLPSWSPRLDRQVIVVPKDVTGLMLVGAMSIHVPKDVLYVAHDVASAYALVGDPRAREAHELVIARANEVWGRSKLVARIRALLADDLAGATIDTCASRVGISGRSLQRELLRAGTSFSDELRRARAKAARELLIHTDLKVESIATRIGLKSIPRMNAILRREFDITPVELRLRDSRWRNRECD